MKEASDAVPTSNRVPELLYQQGVNQAKDNKIVEASSTFDQIITYYDGSIFVAKAKVELGVIELRNNNYEKAQALLRKSVKREQMILVQKHNIITVYYYIIKIKLRMRSHPLFACDLFLLLTMSGIQNHY